MTSNNPLANYRGFKVHYWGYRGFQIESPKKIYDKVFRTDIEAHAFIDKLLDKK